MGGVKVNLISAAKVSGFTPLTGRPFRRETGSTSFPVRQKFSVLFVLAAILALGLTGCNTTRYSETSKDGNKVEVVNSRVFWSSQQYAITLPNGAQMSATASRGDSEAIKAAIEGTANALTAAAAKAALAAVAK
jgi:hypothetical protein